jgi:histidine ammonia-lyase
VGHRPLSIDELIQVAVHRTPIALSGDPESSARMERSRKHLAAALDQGVPIYGVTTGFGSNCGTRISADQSLKLGEGLLRYHGCGTGPALPPACVRGALLCRVLCLGMGLSGVTGELLQALAAFLNHDIVPVVPSQGSVGASGDLTPMSYVAAALAGEREVFYRGERMPTPRALELAGLQPYRYAAKEPLSMLNGTPIMTGVAIVVVDRVRHLLAAAAKATALSMHAMMGHVHHLHPVLFEAKPFAGQRAVADQIRALLRSEAGAPECEAPDTLQDPYSLRCAPHVLGVLADALEWVERWVTIEANSVNDNPLLEPESGRVLMGGNFYGGHIAFAMDGVKAAVASVADLCDRQVALMVDPRLSRGLPGQLAVQGTNGDAPRHGFKGLQITMSALAAEALHSSMPVASFSRPTESNNQDKVSMGTIAARDALRVCELVEAVVGIHLVIAAQGCELRGHLSARPELARLVTEIRATSPSLVDDRCLDAELLAMAERVRRGAFDPGAAP